MSQKLETSKTEGPHHHLSRLQGDWEGTTKVWFEPNNPTDESAVKGTMRLILDGRFILHQYTGSFGGKPLEGLAIYGYHLGLQKYQSLWLDSFHNDAAMMFSEGTKESERMNVLGSYAYVTPEAEQHWGWRTELEVATNDEVVITMYNISPKGEEQKAVETVYRRVG